MTKQNYMRAYPLAERCRAGTLAECDMLAMSSRLHRRADGLAAHDEA